MGDRCRHDQWVRVNDRLAKCTSCRKYIKRMISPRGWINNRKREGEYHEPLNYTREERRRVGKGFRSSGIKPEGYQRSAQP